MGLMSIDRRCSECGESDWVTVERAEKDDSWDCGWCGAIGTVKRAFLKFPGVAQASYPDGVRTDLNNHKEAMKLRAESYGKKPETRKQMEAEIKKLEAIKK